LDIEPRNTGKPFSYRDNLNKRINNKESYWKMNEKQTWKLTNLEVYYIYKSLKNLPTNHLPKDEIQIIENLTKRFGSASSNIIEDGNQKE
jgi:hypothetical protein